MTVLSVLIASFALQGTKPSDMRAIDVKPAGVSVSVPKSWQLNPKDTNFVASYKIPIAGSKNFGRMDLSYSLDESKDVDGFLSASKNILVSGGNTVERQWKVDIMDAPLALTRYSKAGTTTVRGILFKAEKAKFVIAVSSSSEDFDKVEPFLLSTLETLKPIKVVQAKQPVVATEKTIKISRQYAGSVVKLPIAQPVTVGSKGLYVHFPAGTKVSKSSDGTLSVARPELKGTITLVPYSSEGNSPSIVYQTKTAESCKLFKGAIERIDESLQNNPDKQNRDFVWRTGTSEKSSSPLMTVDCVITQVNPFFLYAYYSSNDAPIFKHEKNVIRQFLTRVTITDKP